MNPKVSVLMPVYNGATYLREAIDSILAQTFVDFEFLIINDGSTDLSETIIASYDDSRIKYLKNDHNRGLVNTLNLGIEAAQGEYIARMDADDISLPARFATQVAFLDQQPNVGACGTGYRYFGEVNEEKLLPSDPQEAFVLLSSTSCLGHPTSMIRKSVLDHHSIRYESDYEYAEDYAFWIRISQVASLCSLPESLLLYRWHPHNKSKTDTSGLLARNKARVLWHELLLGWPLEAAQKRYLSENSNDWKTLWAGKRMIEAILENKARSAALDPVYFGKMAVTDWELRMIDRFGLWGLMVCVAQPAFQRWSRATPAGLVAQYLHQIGLLSKR